MGMNMFNFLNRIIFYTFSLFTLSLQYLVCTCFSVYTRTCIYTCYSCSTHVLVLNVTCLYHQTGDLFRDWVANQFDYNTATATCQH